jgi:hypothetical protein
VSPFRRTNPFVQSVSKPHRGQGSRTAKYPILVYSIYGDEAGFAELMPQQEEWMMKPLWTFAEAVVARTTSTILGADAVCPQRRPPRSPRRRGRADDH